MHSGWKVQIDGDKTSVLVVIIIIKVLVNNSTWKVGQNLKYKTDIEILITKNYSIYVVKSV